jgi:hypothetical protein
MKTPKTKLPLTFLKWTKINVQNGFLRDYLFFLKKKISKIQKFYFRCIIGKASKKFQNVFFCKKFGRRWPNGQKFRCVKIAKNSFEKSAKSPYKNVGKKITKVKQHMFMNSAISVFT